MECLICFTCRKRIAPGEISVGLHNHPLQEAVAAVAVEEAQPAWKTYLRKAAQPFGGIRPHSEHD